MHVLLIWLTLATAPAAVHPEAPAKDSTLHDTLRLRARWMAPRHDGLRFHSFESLMSMLRLSAPPPHLVAIETAVHEAMHHEDAVARPAPAKTTAPDGRRALGRLPRGARLGVTPRARHAMALRDLGAGLGK